MSTVNKTLGRRFIEDGFNQGNLAAAGEIVAANFTNRDPGTPELPSGPEGYKQLVSMYRAAFPDLNLSVDDVIAEGDKAVVRWTASGTNNGELMGMPPTGKQVTVTGISILAIADGKVTEQRANWDTLGMLQQLGVVPAPQQA